MGKRLYEQNPEKGDRKMGGSITGTVLAAWLCSLVHAQSVGDAKRAEAKPEFEVAAIKPSARGVTQSGPEKGAGMDDPGRVTYNYSTIRDLVMDAYGMKNYQVSGGPNWLDSERFDIVAKVPKGATKEQIRAMLQNLLADRFQLTLHRESKELPMYALTVVAKGSKLKDSAVTDAEPTEDGRGQAGAQADVAPPPLPQGVEKSRAKIGPDGCPEAPPVTAGNFMMVTPNGVCMISNGHTMGDLATQLSNRLNRPVIDQTGLKGRYDLRLRYDPSNMPGGRGGGAVRMIPGGPGAGPTSGDLADRTTPDGDPPPSIFEALQEQLGLKLEAKKGPVDVLVIDHVEKTPRQN